MRVVGPGNVGLDFLNAAAQKSPPLPLRDGGNGGLLSLLAGVEVAGPSKQIEVNARPGIGPGKHTLPAIQHRVHLFRGSPVQDGGREPRQAKQLTGAGQAGPPVIQPAPIGDFLGQRPGSLIVSYFLIHIHKRPRISRYQGESAHLPGS